MTSVAAPFFSSLTPIEDPQAVAESILEDPIYVDDGVRGEANWLTQLGERVLEALQNLLPETDGPDLSGLNWFGVDSSFLTPLVWALVIAGLLFFAVMVIRNFDPKKRGERKARAGGLLDDDEPDRTADEWLVLADELTAEGRYREAIRSLYLACLMRFDDHGVAPFRRHETNWEHLRRIEESPRLPEAVDFRSSTQRFDHVWYGYAQVDASDVAQFRERYVSTLKALEGVAVA